MPQSSLVTGFTRFIRGFLRTGSLQPSSQCSASQWPIGTLNGAKYLGRDQQIGSIVAGKRADLMLVTGDPSRVIADVRNVDTVFRQGIGFDPAKLIQSVTGKVGIW